MESKLIWAILLPLIVVYTMGTLILTSKDVHDGKKIKLSPVWASGIAWSLFYYLQ